jgi:ferredoxin
VKFNALIEDSGEGFVCDDATSLLRSMECLGRRGIPVGCRGGGCGVCKVRVTQGRYRTEKMSRAWVTREEEASGHALACRLFPQGDLKVRIVGRMRGAVLGVRCESKFVFPAGAAPANNEN